MKKHEKHVEGKIFTPVSSNRISGARALSSNLRDAQKEKNERRTQSAIKVRPAVGYDEVNLSY